MLISWQYRDGLLTACNAYNQRYSLRDDIPARGRFLASLLNSCPELSQWLVPPSMLHQVQIAASLH